MMRLSAALTRRVLDDAAWLACVAPTCVEDAAEVRGADASTAWRFATGADFEDGGTARDCCALPWPPRVFGVEGLTSSSQTNMVDFLCVRII
jgi:hypothetical protein